MIPGSMVFILLLFSGLYKGFINMALATQYFHFLRKEF